MSTHGFRSERRRPVPGSSWRTMGASRRPVEAAEAEIDADYADALEWAHTCEDAAAPRDCPACEGRPGGCGVCGGLGFVAEADWARALSLAFVVACELVPPCTGDAS